MPGFDLPRRTAAEALGTALLVATVVGSGIMAETLTRDVALALLGNTIATGAMLVVLITILGPISGAHFNPAVSLVFALKGDLPRTEAGLYALAQVAGGIIGTVIAHLMFALPVLAMSQHARTGASRWFAEAVATFGLVVTILAGIRFAHAAVPWLVGLYITAAYWFTASTSFANPRRLDRTRLHRHLLRHPPHRPPGLRRRPARRRPVRHGAAGLAAAHARRRDRPPQPRGPAMTVTIYHNPSCGTSRNTLAMIRATGTEPTIIEYLNSPPTRAELLDLVHRMGIPLRDVLRRKGTPYDALGLDDPDLPDAVLLDAVEAHPILINRPIVVTPNGARLCRPSERVLDLLEAPLPAHFTKEDGTPAAPTPA